MGMFGNKNKTNEERPDKGMKNETDRKESERQAKINERQAAAREKEREKYLRTVEEEMQLYNIIKPDISERVAAKDNNVEPIDDYYEYSLETITDQSSGSTDIVTFRAVVDSYAEHGWHVKTIFTNEIGKNTSVMGIGGIASGNNSTIDQVVIIFERKIKHKQQGN